MPKTPRNASMTTEGTVEESVHVDRKLLQLASGLWEPAPLESDKLLDHLAICPHCKLVLDQLLIAQKESQDREHHPGPLYQHTLLKIERLLGQLHDPNEMSAYIYTLEKGGKAQAHNLFPALAIHISRCRTCQNDVEAIQAMMKED